MSHRLFFCPKASCKAGVNDVVVDELSAPGVLQRVTRGILRYTLSTLRYIKVQLTKDEATNRMETINSRLPKAINCFWQNAETPTLEKSR